MSRNAYAALIACILLATAIGLATRRGGDSSSAIRVHLVPAAHRENLCARDSATRCSTKTSRPPVAHVFTRVWDRHRLVCLSPKARVVWTRLHATQRFAGCTLTARFHVLTPITPIRTPTPTPAPTRTPYRIVTPTPYIAPTPWPTVANSPAADALQLINQHRAQYGRPPLVMNNAISSSLQHAVDMAATGSIWHVNPSFPSDSFPATITARYSTAGENVGESGFFGSDPGPGIQAIDGAMWSEGVSNCTTAISHACNMIDPSFTQAGIGIYIANGAVWYVTDFIG